LRAFLDGYKAIEQADIDRELSAWPGQTEESEVVDGPTLEEPINTRGSIAEQERLLADLQAQFEDLKVKWRRRSSSADLETFVTQSKAIQARIPENNHLFEERGSLSESTSLD